MLKEDPKFKQYARTKSLYSSTHAGLTPYKTAVDDPDRSVQAPLKHSSGDFRNRSSQT